MSGRSRRHHPAWWAAFLGGLPADIDYVLARAMAKDPSHRYPSGGMLAEDVRDILADDLPRHLAGWKSFFSITSRKGSPALGVGARLGAANHGQPSRWTLARGGRGWVCTGGLEMA